MAKKGAKRDGSKSQAVRDYLAVNPRTSTKAVVEALAKDGLSVSEGLVNKVKYPGPSGKKSGVRKRKATRRGRPAAGGVNQSAAIRGYMADHPSATRPEIRDALRAQGIPVQDSLVHQVFTRAKDGGTSAKRRPGRPKAAARTTASAGGNMSAAELIHAKQLVDQLGGIDKVRDALSLLEQLQ